MKVLILCCFIVLARGQAEFPCCGPHKKWEADEGLMIGANKGGVGSLTMGKLKLSYDDNSQMVNTDGMLWTNGKSSHIRILQDFKKGIQYTVTGGNCTPTALQYKFIPSCVPVGSKKLPSTYFGLPNNPISVDMYMSKLKELDIDMIITVIPQGDPSDKICMPMSEVLYGGGPSSGQMMNIGFTNYTSDIRDPHVFDVPPECKHVPMAKTTKEHMGRYPRHLFE